MGLRLDPSTSCDNGGGVCCVVPLPACADLGGVCQATPGIAISDVCPQGTIDGDCGDAGVCCGPPGGDDGSSSDADSQVLDAQSTDVENTPETGVIGSCNEAPCASGCTCVPFSLEAGPVPPDAAPQLDAGGAQCVCAFVDASADAAGLEDAEAGDEGTSDESDAAKMSDATEEGDVMTPTDGSAEAATVAPCGVILCAAGCTCTSPAASACVCP